MKNKNKELIDLIREELKAAPDRPYREGAWESYKAKYEPARKTSYIIPFTIAAAVALIFGFAFLFTNQDSFSPQENRVAASRGKVDLSAESNKIPEESTIIDREHLIPIDESNRHSTKQSSNEITITYRAPSSQGMSPSPSRFAALKMEKEAKVYAYSTNHNQLRNKPLLNRNIKVADAVIFKDMHRPDETSVWDNELINAQPIDPNFAYQRQQSAELSPKKLRITDRFELGAFVSPSTTDRSFDLGGGLVFAYQFNDRLAIRTGASFNQYEVSMLNSKLEGVRLNKAKEAAPIKQTDKVISKEAYMLRTDNFFIPNLNAVTGKVQTLDIPVEIRYHITKQFYAAGGVSYAAVLSQERFDHYEESARIVTYSSASDSEKPAQMTTTTVETSIQSNDQNVNTNGFGGFVNFSVGKKTNIGKTMKVSVEPFVKLPVGQFKRADMNYTNGGIRIITSF